MTQRRNHVRDGGPDEHGDGAHNASQNNSCRCHRSLRSIKRSLLWRATIFGSPARLFIRHSSSGIRHSPMFLDEEAVRGLLRMDELIDAMRGALRDLFAGRGEAPMA